MASSLSDRPRDQKPDTISIPLEDIQNAISSLKPDEFPLTASLRRWSVFFFWLVAVFIGLPVWWIATSVYQADLPIKEMLEWDSGKHMPEYLPLTIPIYTNDVNTDGLDKLMADAQTRISSRFENTYLSPKIVLHNTELGANGQNEHLSITLKYVSDLESRSRSQLKAGTNSFEIQLSSPDLPSQSADIISLINDKIDTSFLDETASLTSILTSENAPRGDSAYNHRVATLDNVSETFRQTLSRRSIIAFKPAPTYHLTFSLFTPTGAPSSWDIARALDHYIHPMLYLLSGVADFTIDTQLQLYSELPPNFREPRFDEESEKWLIDKTDLNGFINSAEWPLSPRIGDGPTINFAMFIPSPQQQPLTIQGTNMTGWIVPQWGSVFILNPESHSPTHLSTDDMEPAMLAFSKNLLQLIGIPNHPSSLALQVSSYQRTLATRLTASACTTLGAIVRLIRSLPSIAVPNSVAFAVTNSTDSLAAAVAAIKANNYHGAVKYAQRANVEAEKAFFDPSMVGQAYSPEEHTMAVYLPLLGPVATPLVMALVREIKGIISRRRANRAA